MRYWHTNTEGKKGVKEQSVSIAAVISSRQSGNPQLTRSGGAKPKSVSTRSAPAGS